MSIALIRSRTSELGPPTHVFIGHVRAGRTAQAYALTSTRLRAQVPEVAFPDYLRSNASCVPKSAADQLAGYNGGGDEYCVEVRLKDGTIQGGRAGVFITFVKENDGWRVEKLSNTWYVGCG